MEEYKNLKVYCGGIEIPLDTKMEFVD